MRVKGGRWSRSSELLQQKEKTGLVQNYNSHEALPLLCGKAPQSHAKGVESPHPQASVARLGRRYLSSPSPSRHRPLKLVSWEVSKATVRPGGSPKEKNATRK